MNIDISQLNPDQLRDLKKKIMAQEKLATQERKQAWEKAKHEFVEESLDMAHDYHSLLGKFKQETFKIADKFQEEMLGFTNSKRSSMNNFYLQNKKEDKKIEISTHFKPVYDETFLAGIQKIQAWLESTIKKTDKNMALIVQKSLSRNRNNEFNSNKLMELLSLESKINEPEFSEGCQIIHESFKRGDTTRYLLFKRKDKNGKWHTITLQFSAL